MEGETSGRAIEKTDGGERERGGTRGDGGENRREGMGTKRSRGDVEGEGDGSWIGMWTEGERRRGRGVSMRRGRSQGGGTVQDGENGGPNCNITCRVHVLQAVDWGGQSGATGYYSTVGCSTQGWPPPFSIPCGSQLSEHNPSTREARSARGRVGMWEWESFILISF